MKLLLLWNFWTVPKRWMQLTFRLSTSLFHSICRSWTVRTAWSHVSTTARCATTPPRPASTWCSTPAQLATSRTKDWGNSSCTSKAWEEMRMGWAFMSCSMSRSAPAAKVCAFSTYFVCFNCWYLRIFVSFKAISVNTLGINFLSHLLFLFFSGGVHTWPDFNIFYWLPLLFFFLLFFFFLDF